MPVDELTQTETFQQRHRAWPLLPPVKALEFRHDQHVVEHGAPVQQQVALKHHAKPERRPVHRLAANQKLTAGQVLKPSHAFQQRALAAAGRPKQRNELAVLDIQGDVLQCDHLAAAGRIGLPAAAHLDASWPHLQRGAQAIISLV